MNAAVDRADAALARRAAQALGLPGAPVIGKPRDTGLQVGHANQTADGRRCAPAPNLGVSQGLTRAPTVAGLRPDQQQYLDGMRKYSVQHAPTAEVDAQKLAASSRPLTTADRQAIAAAQAAVAAAPIRPIAQGKNQVQLEVSFDGTGNNGMTAEWQTNPALLHDSFAGAGKTYVRGVGTNPDGDRSKLGLVGKVREQVTGDGMSPRLEQAYAQVVAQVNEAKRKNPDAEISLVVTGFSRGAATARQFVNMLNDRGIPNVGDPAGGNFGPPRVGALVIFDTVDSHSNHVGAETIPPNVDNVLHLTARDEHRPAFPLTTAQSQGKPDPRVTEVRMPGAHSDIGGGYPNGYSDLSRAMAYDYMARAGVQLRPEARPRVDVNDPALRLHDSTWKVRDTTLLGGAAARVLEVVAGGRTGQSIQDSEGGAGRRVLAPQTR